MLDVLHKHYYLLTIKNTRTMKTIKFLAILCLSALIFASCEKIEKRPTMPGSPYTDYFFIKNVDGKKVWGVAEDYHSKTISIHLM